MNAPSLWQTALALLLTTALAAAQDGDRDGRRRDGGRDWDPAQRLREMDANGDGRLEEKELSDRARGYYLRRFQEAGYDLSRPVPINDLIDALRGRGNRGDRDADNSRNGQQDSRPATNNSNSNSNKKEIKRLVPGFGAAAGTSAVPGFGEAEQGPIRSQGVPLEDRYTQAAIRYVDGILQRYDRDHSQVLERAEWAGVSWRSDPAKSDLNGDGKLSREELCERVKDFDEVRGTPAPAAGGSNGADRQKLNEVAKSLMDRFDANKNGVIDQDEVKRMGGYYQNADTNGDRMLSHDELVNHSAAFGKTDGAGGSSSGGPTSNATKVAPGESYRVTAEGVEGSGTYRPRTDTQRLPKGLPDWFARNDADADGQIAMAEFSTAWTEAKLAEFRKYDVNSDGVITPEEYLASIKRGVKRQ